MAIKLLKNHMIMNNTMLVRAASLLLASALLGQPALADGDSSVGKELAYTCLGCHGIDGYRNAYPSYRVPKLGGQKAAYLVAALKGYRNGSRAHPTMVAQASSLSDQDIEDVAAYLASIAGETVAAGGSGEANLEAAKPCTACHGQTGISVNAIWPTLAGQHEDYLLQSLEHYRDGSRSEPVMAAQAALIAEEDVEILAHYFASLDGLETTEID
jgi:cytochrome c553